MTDANAPVELANDDHSTRKYATRNLYGSDVVIAEDKDGVLWSRREIVPFLPNLYLVIEYYQKESEDESNALDRGDGNLRGSNSGNDASNRAGRGH